MKIGIPAEIKDFECRVAATPETIKKILALNCQVLVQKGAGERASVTDAAYQAVGAELVSAGEVYKADIILKCAHQNLAKLKPCRREQF